MPVIYKIFFTVFFFFILGESYGQQQVSLQQDTSKTIQIIFARSLRQITVDSGTVLQTLAGDARVKQGNTILSGDSIVLNPQTGVAEVFGNVHVNDADSVHTYAQYLKYVGNDRIAYLKRSVKLTDGKAVLTTEDLEYNLATGIATYKDGGRVVNGKTVLTSRDATYYSDTKDVFFKRDVHLVDPKYDMRADSLRYNTEFKEAYFISQTHIISKDGIIDTRSGTYNLETGEAVFLDRTVFRDSTHFMSGEKVAFEEKSGIIQIERNGKFVDSANNVTVLGDQLLINRKENSFLATRKPVMIFYRDNDSTYVAADTLFSGLRKYDAGEISITGKTDSLLTDSTGKFLSRTDTSRIGNTDSLKSLTKEKDTLISNTVTDTLKKTTAININNTPKDSIRYFLGFHHVRIYNDSLQAVSDSMHYSTEDSTFKLFGNPIFWNDRTQVKGDTMYLFTENQKAKRLYVFFNGIVINKTREGFYHQMGGRTINGFFKDGTVDYIRVKGSPAESIFYPQDDDSAYIGMNRSKGDVIDIYFVKKELNKIKFVNDVDGTLYPLKQVPADLKFLKNFQWLDARRPKNKLELFE